MLIRVLVDGHRVRRMDDESLRACLQNPVRDEQACVPGGNMDDALRRLHAGVGRHVRICLQNDSIMLECFAPALSRFSRDVMHEGQQNGGYYRD